LHSGNDVLHLHLQMVVIVYLFRSEGLKHIGP